MTDATPSPVSHAELVSAFDEALAENQTEIHYQPVLNFNTGQVAFVEALFRCPDRSGAYISNGELIPALRHNDRMAALTEYVVVRVLDQLSEWRESGLVERISLNLPSELLEDQSFLWWLIDVVVSSKVAPSNVLLEISGADFAASSSTEAGIRRLAFAGFPLALDASDLSASELVSLRDWTLHMLKVNRSLIGDLQSIYGQSLLSALDGFCSTIELDWAIVGVESAEEMAILKERGARVMQGFHLAPPMNPSACADWLDRCNDASAIQPFEMQPAGHC